MKPAVIYSEANTSRWWFLKAYVPDLVLTHLKQKTKKIITSKPEERKIQRKEPNYLFRPVQLQSFLKPSQRIWAQHLLPPQMKTD